jgi:hypothetical protein
MTLYVYFVSYLKGLLFGAPRSGNALTILTFFEKRCNTPRAVSGAAKIGKSDITRPQNGYILKTEKKLFLPPY